MSRKERREHVGLKISWMNQYNNLKNNIKISKERLIICTGEITKKETGRKTTVWLYIKDPHYKFHLRRNGHGLPDIGLAVRVFAIRPGDLGSFPGRVIPKIQKMVLDASLLNTQHYKIRIKGKVEQSREGVAPSPTHRCSSYRKRSLQVSFNSSTKQYNKYELL